MADPALMVFRSAGLLHAVPQDKVLSVSAWRPAKKLPRGAPWLEGLLDEGGELVPVLKEEILGPGADVPEVIVLLEEQGRRLAIPGRGPVLRGGGAEAKRPQDEDARPGGSGKGSEEIRILDSRLLYTTLGLLYNETGSNRGS
jgi:hypothetical protein